MTEIDFDNAEKIFDSGMPVFFVDKSDLTYTTPEKAGIVVSKTENKSFNEEVSEWYVFHWGASKPNLTFFINE